MATASTAPDPDESPLLELDDLVTDDDQDAVAAEVRALMGRYKISQPRLAAAIGITQAGLSKRLNGKTNFTVRELYRIARLFRVSIRDLFPPVIVATAAVLYVTRNEHPPEQLTLPFSANLQETGDAPNVAGEVEAGPATPPVPQRRAA